MPAGGASGSPRLTSRQPPVRRRLRPVSLVPGKRGREFTVSGLSYSSVRPRVAQADLATVSRFMFWLLFRNVASDGLVFDDPVNAGIVSVPGCVLASPSWENSQR